MQTPHETHRPLSRLDGIDQVRGLAIVAMVVYHAAWDLAYVGLVDWDVAGAPLWRGFAMSIAGTFLVLVGISLVLADRAGVPLTRRLRRIGVIAAAAALVTGVTLVVFPATFVFFGILHMIALGSLLALPLVRAPVPLVAVAALLVLAMPSIATGPLFDAPTLLPLGLAETARPSNDYVPVFPWFAGILAGIVLGRLLPAGDGRGTPGRTTAVSGPAGRILATLGRWSLVIYLVHQPVLFGLASGAAALVPIDPAAERARFTKGCQQECTRGAGDEALCRAFCGCVTDALDGTLMFQTRDADPSLDSLVAAAAGSCRSSLEYDDLLGGGGE